MNTNQPKWTQGEWKKEGLTIRSYGRGDICKVLLPKDGGTMDAMANLSLLFASPDLYAMLSEALDTMIAHRCGTTKQHEAFDSALRKARGEK